MKIIMGIFTLGILAGGPIAAIGGEINTLLEVDITDPSRVKITATDASPSVSNTGSVTYNGVSLEGFFTTYALFEGPARGDLSPNGVNLPYNHAESPEAENYLNIYRGGIRQQSFDTSQQAFYGSLEVDLRDQLISEPGSVGDISIGDSSAEVIGQWAIIDSSAAVAESDAANKVPEPGSAALLALGLAAITCRRQR